MDIFGPDKGVGGGIFSELRKLQIFCHFFPFILSFKFGTVEADEKCIKGDFGDKLRDTVLEMPNQVKAVSSCFLDPSSVSAVIHCLCSLSWPNLITPCRFILCSEVKA